MQADEDRINGHFSGTANSYDDLIPKVIPRYFEQSAIMLQLIPFDRLDCLKVLDLGAGTGVLSELVLKNFANANVHLFDLSADMLDVCRRKLAEHGNRLTCQTGNFENADFGSDYDLIVSGLAIHHLEAAEKNTLFRRLFKATNEGGMLLIRDCVTGNTPELTRTYERLWRDYMKGCGTDDAACFANYEEEDSPSSVEEQMEWMSEAGFTEVGCHWRYLNFAVFSGRR